MIQTLAYKAYGKPTITAWTKRHIPTHWTTAPQLPFLTRLFRFQGLFKHSSENRSSGLLKCFQWSGNILFHGNEMSCWNSRNVWQILKGLKNLKYFFKLVPLNFWRMFTVETFKWLQSKACYNNLFWSYPKRLIEVLHYI